MNPKHNMNRNIIQIVDDRYQFIIYRSKIMMLYVDMI